MNAREARLFSDLVGALAERFSTAGHPMAFVTQEHRGLCPPYEDGPTCVRLRALLLEACDVLDGKLAGIGKRHRIGYERAWIDCLVWTEQQDCFMEWKS